MTLRKNIKKKATVNQLEEAFLELLDFYAKPSFGSIKQREFDIFLFGKLQELGAFDNKDDIYEVVSKLRITRSKARNLIYENNLRKLDIATLDHQLKQELQKARFLKGGNYLISLEIENPLLIDHLKAKLKKLGYSSDGSFSPDIIKLSTEALTALIQDYLDLETQKKIKQLFISLGYEKDKSFKGYIVSFLGHIAKNLTGKAGEVAVNEYLEPFISGSFEQISALIKKNESD